MLSVVSQSLCYFVCATVCYANCGVSKEVGYLTDLGVMECKGGPFLSLFPGFSVVLPAGSTTQNKAVITNNSTTIGLFTTDTADKNLQPK